MTQATADQLPCPHPTTVPESPSSPVPDFSFAFNDSHFSDRVRRIEILPDIPDFQSDGNAYVRNSDWVRNRKRRRAESNHQSAEDIVVQYEEQQVLHCRMLDTEDFAVCENQDESES